METKSIKLDATQALVILQALQHDILASVKRDDYDEFKINKIKELTKLHDYIISYFEDLQTVYNK